jgi:transposase
MSCADRKARRRKIAQAVHGMTTMEAAEHFGVDRSTVTYCCREFNVPLLYKRARPKRGA